MTNQSTSYGMLEIKCFGTKLYSQQFVILDSGRYITIVPKWGFIGDSHSLDGTYSYKYFVKESLDYILHEFLLSDDHEAIWARDRLYKGIVIYESEIEKETFEVFLQKNTHLTPY
ncbi:hypothetical protein [Bacillus sp. REN16]|uniref:hypothetical protein n=1 Tax=Bacillus sp. REN16 TaxID=2887296 RepID=UPI001E5AB167|nr:hypothetical protein [Bacillus sp. REN16]MCC3359667.1 hypothetical protein [Bacillus sp. REN16]